MAIDIKNIVATQLDESYGIIKEIRILANEILKVGARRTVAKTYQNGGIYRGLEPVTIDEYWFEPDNYPELDKFIEGGSVIVRFVPRKEQEKYGITRGNYMHPMDADTFKPRLGSRYQKIINLFYDEEEVQKIFEEHLTKYQKPIDATELYFKYWFLFNSTLMHELTHATDVFRSNGQAIYNSKNIDYFKRYATMTNNKIQDDYEDYMKKHMEYLNLSHEVWARFTQAVQRIRFVKLNLADDDIMTPSYEMAPLKNVISDFKYEMDGFQQLPDDQKRRLLSRIVQFWGKEQDEVKKWVAVTNKKIKDLKKRNEPITHDTFGKPNLLREDDYNSRDITVDIDKQRILLGSELVGEINLIIRGEYIILDKIEIERQHRGKGYGTKAMLELINWANDHNKVLTLTPDEVFGGNKKKLTAWYKSLGFIMNKGKNKDFQTMQLMYKLPDTYQEEINEEATDQQVLFRGGFELDNQAVKDDGISFTTDYEIAQYWSGSHVDGEVRRYKLDDNAKILKPGDFPDTIKPRDIPATHADKARIVNFALVKGYDGVDLSEHFNEEEIRIFNPAVVKVVSN